MVKRRLYQAVNQLNCCVVGVGCGLIVLVSSGVLTGVAGYGAYRVLS